MKKKNVAKYLRKRYGYCKDKHFQIGCICCEVSRVIRELEGRDQPVSDAVMQRLMHQDCPSHEEPVTEEMTIIDTNKPGWPTVWRGPS